MQPNPSALETHLATVESAIESIRTIVSAMLPADGEPVTVDQAQAAVDRAVHRLAVIAREKIDAVKEELEDEKTLRAVSDDKAQAFADVLQGASGLADAVLQDVTPEAGSRELFDLARQVSERIKTL